MKIDQVLHSGKLILGVLLLTAAMLGIAVAQETAGAISGTVSDASGASIPGATIKVEGVAFTRTATTNSDGFYRMLQVPPGVYKISVTADRFSAATVEAVNVILGKTTPVDVALKVGSVTEQVVITSDDIARIDPNDNKIQTNITSRMIDSLPKGTNLITLLKISPAVRQEPKSGQLQIDGASGSENSFIIDGQETSNFRTGILNNNNNIPFQFVQEVQIKTSGFEAEYGGATGGVINVVTKGGSNEFHGLAEYQFEPGGFQAGPRPVLYKYRTGTGATFRQVNSYLRPDKDDFTNHFPSFGIGGPVLKDRIWFFTSYSPQIFKTQRNVKYLVPDPSVTTPEATVRYDKTERREYWQNRIDGSVTNNLRLSSTFTWNPIIEEGLFPTVTAHNINRATNPTQTIPTADFGGSTGRLTGSDFLGRQGGRQNSNNVTFQAVYTPKDNLVASFRFSRGFLNERLNSYFVPTQTRFVCTGVSVAAVPSTAGCGFGFSNFPSNTNIFFDVSTRLNFEGDVSYIVNRFGGRHEFKGGYQNSKVTNDVSRGYQDYGVVTLNYGRTINDLTGRRDPVTPGTIGAGQIVRFGTRGSALNRAQSLYIQDRWQPISRLSINAGVRFEKENLPSFNGFAPPINFGWGDKIVPRVGFAYDITGDGKTKAFFSYGQFTDRLKFELPRGSFGGDFYRIDYFEITPDQPNYSYYSKDRILGNSVDVLGGKCPITGTTGLTRCQYDYRIASNDPNADIYTGFVDPNLNPFRQTEFTVGFERELSRKYLVSVRYSNKHINNAVEDAGFPTPEGSEAYIIGNPGQGLYAELSKQFGYAKAAKPQRRYDAVEFKLDRRFDESPYQYLVSYTYSRLYGNYSGLASSDENGRTSPGVNRFFDLPHLGFTAAGQPDNGRLATDRPHVFNASGSYNFKWFNRAKGQNTLFSFFTTLQSGTPRTTFYTLYAGAVYEGRGNLGRTPRFSQTDFALSHRYRMKERYEVAFDFNVINLFNRASVLTLSDSAFAVNPSLGTLGLPAAIDDEPKALNYILTNGILPQLRAYLADPANPQRVDNSVNYGSEFQNGRAIRLGVRFTF
jgi:hypothetical protein